MARLSLLAVALIGLCGRTIQASGQFDPSSYAPSDVITRDIAVIGGGSSGTYGAVNLHALGKSVVLVEKEAALGGHINTYTDPVTGKTADYGVQTFWNHSTTWNYFQLLGINGVTYNVSHTPVYADFTTGQHLTVNSGTNYSAYAAQLEKYPYLAGSWDLPYPVPQDLVLTFGDFVTKYNLGNVAYNIYFFSQGAANFLKQLTINIFKIFDQTVIGIFGGGDVSVPNSNNKEIFVKATGLLGSSNILLSSTIVASQRQNGSSGISLVAQTPGGKKLIRASKLLISIPPLLSNMQPYDLSEQEQDLFSQWTYSSYYVLLLNQTGLPANYQFKNAISSSSTYNIPKLPAAYQVTQSNVPGLFYVWYGSATPLNQTQIESDVLAVITRLQKSTSGAKQTTPSFVRFNSHTPFKLEVTKDVLEGGFYDRLEALQGLRNTYYTGAAFVSQASGILWNYTHTLLPEITK